MNGSYDRWLAFLIAAVVPTLPTPVSAVEVATEPVGFYVVTAKKGVNLFVPGLVAPEEFTGRMAGLDPGPTNSIFTFPQAEWPAGQFDELPSFPTHYVEILDAEHPARGLVIDVVQNDSDELTVAIDGATLNAYEITGNEQIRLRRHTTLKTFFENTAITPFSDEVKLVRPGATLRYIHNGTHWLNSGALTNGDDQVIYPGEGFSFNTSEPEKDIVVGGNAISSVKMTPTLVNIYGGERNYIGQVNPLTGRNGLISDIDFSGAFTSPFSDSVKILVNSGNTNNPETLARYIFNGTQLVDAGTFQPSSADPVPYGYALWVRTREDLTILLPPGF